MAGGDVDADGTSEILAAPGPGAGASFVPRFRGFDYDGNAVALLPGCDVTTSLSTSFGGRVGRGDITGSGREAILAASGPDASAAATVEPFHYTGTLLAPLLAVDLFPAYAYGAHAQGIDTGY